MAYMPPYSPPAYDRDDDGDEADALALADRLADYAPAPYAPFTVPMARAMVSFGVGPHVTP